MYRCEKCKQLTYGKSNTVVLEKREKNYTDRRGNQGVGWEIAREARYCGQCANQHKVKEAASG